MSRSYGTEAIVLRVIPFGETSQVVHLGTPGHGLVPALAKGARRPGPDFQGGLGLGVIGEASLKTRRGELELLTRFRQQDRHRPLAASLRRFFAACHTIDLLRTWLRPALPNPALYEAGRTALGAIARAKETSMPAWVVWFEARAVGAAGHRPRLMGCAGCGETMPEGTWFAPRAGGLVHAACVTGGPRCAVSAADRAALRRLYDATLADLGREPPTLDEVRAVRRIHDLWLVHVLERRPLALASIPRP